MENAQINEGLDIDLSDQELNKAATKIQASFRGHKVRKEMKKAEDGDKTPTELDPTQSKDDELPIDPDDPEVQKAAAKIQASFRGYMVRKQVKDMQSPTSEAPGS